MALHSATIADRALNHRAATFAFSRAPKWSGLLALNYHRIGDPLQTPFDRGTFSATVADFDRHMAILARSVDVISPRDLDLLSPNAKGRYVIVTFDDGYRDNAEFAVPSLRRHGIPATFFIPTGYIDRRALSWWDEIAWMIRHAPNTTLPAGRWFASPVSLSDVERAIRITLDRYKQLPGSETANYLDCLAEATGSGRAPAELGQQMWMDWETIVSLQRSGMTIGGHTVNHPLLARLTADEQRTEIAGCRDRLALHLGAAPTSFAYPVGHRDAFDATTKRLLVELGFTNAFSFYRGMQRLDRIDRLDIRRIGISARFTPSVFSSLLDLPALLAR